MLFQIYFTVHAFFVLLQIIFLQLACTLPALGFIVLVIFPGLVPESPRFQVFTFSAWGDFLDSSTLGLWINENSIAAKVAVGGWPEE